MSVGSAAAKILQRGVELDNKKRYTEALVCYQEGLQVLVDMMKGEINLNLSAFLKNEVSGETGEKRVYLRSKIEEYMKRAEFIKTNVDKLKEEGKYSEQINIENNAVGFSYKKVFGRFLDEVVLNVKIEDPYIRSFHQCQNLVRFCELLVDKCPNLKYINLNTTKDTENSEQRKWLDDLVNDLKKYNVVLNVIYSATLHDREIT